MIGVPPLGSWQTRSFLSRLLVRLSLTGTRQVCAPSAGLGPCLTAGLTTAGCGKTPCKIRHRFDFLRPEQARRGWRMRGRDHQRGHLGAPVAPEALVPPEHPLRQIRPLVNAALARLSPEFDQIYSLTRRPSIPPEQLLRALLLQAFFTVRSERQLVEQLRYNILFRCHVCFQ